MCSSDLAAAGSVRIELVNEAGETTALKEDLQLQEGEVIDASVMSCQELRDFLEREIEDALEKDVLLSLHLKATMMKVSDPIIFGHVVAVFFSDLFAKHADIFDQLGVNPNNGLGDLEAKLEELPEDIWKRIGIDLNSRTNADGKKEANHSMGGIIITDKQAELLLKAAKKDPQNNMFQAPKVTLFNGQQANVSDLSTRPFVTSIIPVVGDFAAAQQPVITVLGEGTTLNVQAVVSHDRRFVRLTLVPSFSQIGNVHTFTFEGTTVTNNGSNQVDANGDPVNNSNNNNIASTISGTTVQLPTFNFTTVTTTVNVPDGGTVLLGGIKRLSEGRNERGVPMLSKLPYISRLFKNVGIGRDTQSLMMMVSPRIIIQREEEERLVGDISE